MEIFDKIDLILIPSIFGLLLIFLFISYLIKVTLEQNDISAYSMMGLYWILNISRLKSLIHKDNSAKSLYYFTLTILALIGLIILYFIFRIII